MQQYLKFHDNPKTFYKHIQDLKATKYKNKIDLFVWGSPCQDLSLAGNAISVNVMQYLLKSLYKKEEFNNVNLLDFILKPSI